MRLFVRKVARQLIHEILQRLDFVLGRSDPNDVFAICCRNSRKEVLGIFRHDMREAAAA